MLKVLQVRVGAAGAVLEVPRVLVLKVPQVLVPEVQLRSTAPSAPHLQHRTFSTAPSAPHLQRRTFSTAPPAPTRTFSTLSTDTGLVL